MNSSREDKIKMVKAILAHPDFAKMEHALRRDRDLDQRLHLRYRIVVLFSQERSITKVCQHTHVDRKTARKWINRFLEMGLKGLTDMARGGRKPVLTEWMRHKVLHALQEPVPVQYSSPEWTVKVVAKHLNFPYKPVLDFLMEIKHPIVMDLWEKEQAKATQAQATELEQTPEQAQELTQPPVPAQSTEQETAQTSDLSHVSTGH